MELLDRGDGFEPGGRFAVSDVVVRGEGEEALAEMLERFAQTARGYGDTPTRPRN